MARPTLQLADPNFYLSAPNNAYLSANNNMMLSAEADDIYVKVPTQNGIIKVREDMFDTLDPMTYDAVMEYLVPFNDSNVMMNGLFSKWKENKQQRKDDRAQKKLNKIAARGDARANVAASGGGVAGIIGKIGDIAGNFFGGGGGQTAPDQRSAGIGGTVNFGSNPQMSTPIYKQPWFWGIMGALGIGAVVLSRRH